MTLYRIPSNAMQTTAAPVAVATGVAIKTIQQIVTPSDRGLKIKKWGYRFASAPTAVVVTELVETAAVAATVTPHSATGVQPQDDAVAGLVSGFTLSASGTGFNSTNEGIVAATREFDNYACPIGISSYDFEWSLGTEPRIGPGRVLRIRMTTNPTINVYSYIVVEPT